MDYAHTYPNSVIRYHTSNMRLHIDSDAAYLIIPNARNRGAWHFYLSNHLTNPVNLLIKKNGAILTQCTTIKRFISLAAEAETAQVLNNTRAAISIRRTLEEMNHSQKRPTYLKTHNKTSEGFAKSTIRKTHSKAWGMIFHWIRHCIKIGSIWVY